MLKVERNYDLERCWKLCEELGYDDADLQELIGAEGLDGALETLEAHFELFVTDREEERYAEFN
jgi:hypothetical protein